MDSLKVQLQGRDIKRINRVRTFAEQNLLVPKHLLLGAAEADQVTPARFNTTAVTVWQSAAPVTLPYGQPADKNLPVPLRIWSLPDNLIDLAVPQRDVVPRFAFKVGTYDQATGKMATRPVGYYGWGMQIGLAIKRIPPVAGSPATAHTYELVAANEYDIVLLERLLAAISPTYHGVVSDLTLLYLPSPVGQAAQGKQSDGNGNVAFFLTQVNLSTDTHPPALMLALRAAALADDPPTGCYNTAYDFIRLLWEGSITRSGGYFLYYHNFETQEGLPDRVFNDKGEAELTLLVSFRPQTDTDRNRAMSFMNCVITGDISDTPRGDSGEQQAGAAASFTVFAETDPEQRTASPGGSSLDDLAIAYYADAISIGEQNADLPLRVGTTLTVASGVYQVGVGAPGADLAAIAQYFGTSVQAIQAANPRIADWSGLKLSDALRLPALQVPVKAGDSLRKLASFYGEELAALVAENRTVMGLFPDAPPLQVTTGPSVRSALVPPGVVEAKAQRDQPGAVPRNPDDPVFAETYLQNMFHMLGYRVGENQDFTSSDSGLPVGPADPVPEEELGDKARLPAANADGAWQYDRAVPYYKFALPAQARAGDLPPLADNPYRGVGDLLQLDFGWQDIFGNQILTPLDSPTPGSPVNRPPILLGYTDTLLGPGQWPSVGLSYQVLPGTAAVAGLQFAFTFDTQPYESGKETNDDQGPTWQQAAAGDLSTYRRLYYQLNQVLNKQDAVTYAWQTSLLPGDPRPVSAGNIDQLKAWINQIYGYLALRAQGQPGTAPDPLVMPEELPVGQLNQSQVFRLATSLILERPAAYVHAEFRTSPPVWRSVTTVPPLRGQAADGAPLSLTLFAMQLESALGQPGQSQPKLATGADRGAVSQPGVDSPCWIVRLGLTAGQPIAYAMLNPGEPMIYAPAPLDNVLGNRNGVPVWDYKPESGKPIDFTAAPDRTLDFGGIDLDVWGRQFVAAVDRLLSPEYVSPAGILTKRSPSGTNYVRQLLDRKTELANAIRRLVMHVFAADNPPDDQIAAAQEAFRQQLLVRLSSAYATDAVIQFKASVAASVDTGPAQTPGRLFGTLVPRPGTQMPDTVALTAPKLTLAPATADNPALINCLLTSRGNKQDPASAAVQPYVKLAVAYQPTHVEHQIGELPGIMEYQASSWLAFVVPPDPSQPAHWPLYGDLGTFDVPLVLRAYPTPPSLVAQAQEQPQAAQCQVSDPLAQARLWNFAYTYSESYHYTQDRTYFTVLFNIKPALMANAVVTRDLFSDLAEFVTVFPAVQADVDTYVRPLDGAAVNPDAAAKADVALRSAIGIIGRVAQSWQSWHADRGMLRSRLGYRALAQYTFHVSEAADEQGALQVTLVETSARPQGVGAPDIAIEGYTTSVTASGGQFQYTFADGEGPLLANKGLALPARKVVLPCLNVLVMQDAWASGYLTRNEELIKGRRSADPFIYQTPEVKFTGPLLPKVDVADAIDVAAVGSGSPVTRTLAGQLSNLFLNLFQGDVPQQQQIQLECRYSYQLSPNLPAISLPVLMLPHTGIDVTKDFTVPAGGCPDGYDPSAPFVCNLAAAIWQWFAATRPSGVGGALQLDMTVMSTLTAKTTPLLRLENLSLNLVTLNPRPPVL